MAPDVAGLILRANSNMRIGGACASYSFYSKGVSGNVSYKDFEISFEDFDKSRIRISTSYGIYVRHPSDDSEYLCYTGCVKVAVCTDDFPPQCTIGKKCLVYNNQKKSAQKHFLHHLTKHLKIPDLLYITSI